MNPGSRGRKSKKGFNRIFSLLDSKKISYDYEITERLDEASSFSLNANRSGYNIIVAVGGDGTINKVINGFYDKNGKRISNAKLGVIYTGTSPDFCKSYNIPYKDIDESVNLLLQNRSSRIQIGKIVYASKNMPEFQTGYFACCANIGLGVAVARCSNSGIRKWAGDSLGTFLSLLKVYMYYRPDNFTVIFDGRRKFLEKICNISVGKTFYVASGIKVYNDLVEGDGRFYNLIIKKFSLRYLPFYLNVLYSGKKISDNDVISLEYGKTIEIYGNSKDNEIEYDGDPQGFLPCKIEMAEDYLDIINEGNA